MQRRQVPAVLGATFPLLFVVAALGQGEQPSIRVESIYPRYAPRGQVTVINVAVASPDAVQRAEITPSAGVTVSGITGIGSGSEQNVGWWEVTLNVSKDAPPGDRTLLLVLPKGRTTPATFSVSSHAPVISELRSGRPANQSTTELQLSVADADSDIGESPYVWFTADCGGDPIAGALRATMRGGVVRAVLPNVRRAARDGIPVVGKCELQVRLTDSAGIDSNTLKATVDFAN